MKLVRLMVVGLLAVVVSGCACRTKRVGDGDNIPVADAGGPLRDINFAFDKYDLTAASKETLGKNAEWLKANPGTAVQVEGHCDERGTSEYNMALGAKRANAGAEYLKTLGIGGNRVSTVSYGENVPLDPAHNEAAWAKNRRAHFKVSGK
ncbi:MAG: peptidoglycan-associated lipoprotein Pal [Proteobacteria bacterium]|nr:peptidoglycan-associated lipoprotein Pal [Pseudomonadota bacterium]